MMGLYCVKLGVQVEKVLLVKVTGVFEFGLYHWETICVCQIGDRTRMEQSCSEVLFGVVSAVYWSGFYSDGCGMDRTAQWRWEMVIAYDKDKAELGEKSAAAKLVIKWVGFNFFFKWTYYPENFFPQNSCFHYHQIHIRMRRVACQCFFFHASVLFQVWSLHYLFVYEKERWVTVRKECVPVMIPDWQPWSWNLCSTF